MDLYPVTLGITRKKTASGAGSGSASSPLPSPDAGLSNEVRQKIFERDGFACRCCGFMSKKYQTVLIKDYDPSNISDDNLLTVCMFCHQCFHLDQVPAMRSGVLIWMPEIEQARLHHIARAIYVARISQGPIAEAARKALDVIMSRRGEAKKRIHTDDPYILSTVLSDYLSPGHYRMKDKKLAGLRLFPLDRKIVKEADLEFNQFPQILAYWRSKDGPFGGKTPPKWISVYQSILQDAA